MKINGQKPIVNFIYSQNLEKKAEVSRPQQSSQPSSKEGVSREKVSISGMAKDIQKMQKVLENTPDVREEKVVELKARIKEGTYSVKGTLVANKMIRESLLDEIL